MTLKMFASQNSNIYQCFRWLHIVLYYTGSICFRKKGDSLTVSRWNIVYTNIIRIVLVMGFIGGLSSKLTNVQSSDAMFGHLSPVLCFVLAFECTISMLTYLFVSFMMEYQKHNHIRLQDKIDTLDRRTKNDFPFINWNYCKSAQKYTPLTIFIMIFYTTVSLIYVYSISNCNCGIVSTIVTALTYAAITISPAGVGFLHMAQMDMLRIRYRLFRKMFNLYYTDFATKDKDNKDIIENILKLIGHFKKYNELILDINDVFSFVCAAGIFYDFGIMTNMVFLLCQKASESIAPAKEYVFILLFMIPRIYKIIMTASYGYTTDKEKKYCLHIILSCENRFPKNARIIAALDTFSHWKMQNKYDFTIGSIIRANLIITYLILHGIINYVIVLIQLQFQQNNIANQIKSHAIIDDVDIFKIH